MVSYDIPVDHPVVFSVLSKARVFEQFEAQRAATLRSHYGFFNDSLSMVRHC
jgi:hypothetical protein